jgi:hypothetical protein
MDMDMDMDIRFNDKIRIILINQQLFFKKLYYVSHGRNNHNSYNDPQQYGKQSSHYPSQYFKQNWNYVAKKQINSGNDTENIEKFFQRIVHMPPSSG